MNTPNYDNIDRWLFDYVEGNLSSKQESALENYILNHPELEVDLDMWRMSNIKTSNAFVNDIQIAKKTTNRYIFNFINALGILVILLIGRQIHEFDGDLYTGDDQIQQASIKLNNTLEPSNLVTSNTKDIEPEKQNVLIDSSIESFISNAQNGRKITSAEADYVGLIQEKTSMVNTWTSDFMNHPISVDIDLEKLNV